MDPLKPILQTVLIDLLERQIKCRYGAENSLKIENLPMLIQDKKLREEIEQYLSIQNT